MPPDLMEFIAPLIAITSIGTMILIGMKMRLNARLHASSNQNRDEKGREEVERLGEAVDNLHDQLRSMQDEFSELHERVDFAERLLSRGEIRPVEHGVPTPD